MSTTGNCPSAGTRTLGVHAYIVEIVVIFIFNFPLSVLLYKILLIHHLQVLIGTRTIWILIHSSLDTHPYMQVWISSWGQSTQLLNIHVCNCAPASFAYHATGVKALLPQSANTNRLPTSMYMVYGSLLVMVNNQVECSRWGGWGCSLYCVPALVASAVLMWLTDM